MTPEYFADKLVSAVYRVAVDDSVSRLQSPPGRNPAAHHLARSEWYNSLTASDRARITEVMELAAQMALFGLLVLLDGEACVGNWEEFGLFKLTFHSEQGDSDLTPQHGPMLHDLFMEALQRHNAASLQ
jgi:hypothetical protein